MAQPLSVILHLMDNGAKVLYENTAQGHLYAENDLVKACREGQSGARSILYRRYAEKILLQCLKYRGNREDARELLTDVFVAAFERLYQFG